MMRFCYLVCNLVCLSSRVTKTQRNLTSIDLALLSVNQELGFVVGTLQYVIARLGSPMVVETSWKDRHLQSNGQGMVGSFLNLHCGHNNPFSAGEKKRLRSLVLQATSRGES